MKLRDLPAEKARPIARQVIEAFGTPRLRYVPSEMEPTVKQAVALSLDRLEVFYGGAAGPGKSWWLMSAALQYVDVPGYAAGLFRRTFPDLSQPGGLIDLSRQMLGPTDAVYNKNEHQWTFPSGATLTFGHMQHEDDKLNYRGAEYQFLGFDELTTFSETQFTFLFSRLRKPVAPRGGAAPDGTTIDKVPLRMRSASNPGGPGHDWVRDRYVDPTTRDRKRVFIPAWLHENPHLDQDAYRASLAELSEVEQERLIGGDWDAVDAGGMFDPRTWPTVASFAGDWLRVWDLAGSKPTAEYPDPDWTVGLRLDRDPQTLGIFWTDLVMFREDPAQTEQIVKATAIRDGYGPVGIEQEPGSSGKAVISTYSRTVLQGLGSVHAISTTGDKTARARGVAAAGGRGEISVVRAAWNREAFSQLRRFPFASHDDVVDALAHAYNNIGRLVGGLTTSNASVQRLPSRGDRRAR